MRGLVTTSLAAILLVSLGACGSKNAADKEMQALCAKDGGMKVYETVVLPASEFSQYVRPLDQYWSNQSDPESKLGPDYRYVKHFDFLKRGDTLKGEVEMFKSTTQVFRRSDGKLLGQAIEYGRSGGDSYFYLIFGGHPSGFSCPTGAGQLLINIFIRGK
jgi:hypothetical protein